MILKLPLALAKYSGLLIIFEKQNKWYPLLTILTILNTLNFVFPIGIFMVQNIHNFDEFTQSFGALSNMVVNLLKTCMFLVTNRSLKRILGDLERIATDRKRSNHNLSIEADRATEDYVKKFLVIVYFAVIGITCSPLLAMTLEYLNTGRIVNKELPFKSAYILFDVNSSPYYEIAYLITAIGIPACANCIVAIDTIFMGLCLHTVALIKDLKENIRRVDNEAKTVSEFKEGMKRVVEYHNQILQLMVDIEAVFSHLFFVQFNGTIFILCSQSFLATMNFGNSQIISNITFYLASATQFLIYTHFGELLASESQSVADAVAEQEWSQSSRGVSFLNWVHCNRRLFLTLIMTSYNVFAVLQNVKEKSAN